MRIYPAFFLVLVALALGTTAAFCPSASAVPGESAGCGEWTICPSAIKATPTAIATPTPVPVLRPIGDRWNLPACTKDDDLYCKNSCHGKFGGEFWSCVKDCFGQRCSSVNAEAGSVSNEAGEEARGCVELASLDCADQCSDRSGAEASRCRRDCLFAHCRDATSADVAKEAASPGAIRCDRCTARLGPECRAACGAGRWIPPGGVINGLGGLLCERSCISVRCGVGCGVGVP